jgi:hypothetical protein
LTTWASRATCFEVRSADTFLRVRIEQQKQVFSNRPVVNDAGTLALAARSKPYANLADAAATLDESAKIWIRCQPGLKRP